MMNNIHKKTHFKAAISVSRADACCVKVEPNEFGDQFAEMTRNIEAMNRSMKNIEGPMAELGLAARGAQVAAYLNRNRNCFSQGRSRANVKKNSNLTMTELEVLQ